jgi:hypothetical protein
MTGEACTLINRTSKPLTFIQNGVTRVLKPGKNAGTTDQIRFAKTQNPRMGTFDASGQQGQYLVGVEGFDPPEECTMLKPGDEHLRGGHEKFDRSHESFPALEKGTEVVVVPSGVAQPRGRVSEISTLPPDTVVSSQFT